MKCSPSNPIVPPLYDSDPPPSKNRNSLATFTPVITRRSSREKPILNATWQHSTHNSTLPRRNCLNVHGQTASAKAQMGISGETKCCNIRIGCMDGGYDDEGRGVRCCCMWRIQIVVTAKEKKAFLRYVATRNRTRLYKIESLRSWKNLSIRLLNFFERPRVQPTRRYSCSWWGLFWDHSKCVPWLLWWFSISFDTNSSKGL